jgi:NhaC family Na+:H+ antiporter
MHKHLSWEVSHRGWVNNWNLQHRMLSCCLGEGAALTTGIIPWTTAGAFMAGALGVPTLQYAPYAFLNWINPILSIILSYMGIFILWTKDAQTKNS